jgi:hypothetical protein
MWHVLDVVAWFSVLFYVNSVCSYSFSSDQSYDSEHYFVAGYVAVGPVNSNHSFHTAYLGPVEDVR